MDFSHRFNKGTRGDQHEEDTMLKKMQILNLWGLTYAQETEGHPAEEPGGHGRLGQEEVSPR